MTFSRLPYLVWKSSTIDGSISPSFGGFLLYLNLSLERFGWRIRVLEHSRTFYSNSLKLLELFQENVLECSRSLFKKNKIN